ncbi:arginase family protein [Ensifer sp. Root142]|uniref:arginase family protein n=1 Tax=Ensifer sp. Root142 TaxID=1736461 RepID=UPI0009E69071|nr:arginase family protein [Ensifer sp. Root142]
MDHEINVVFCPRARDLGPRGLVDEIKKTVGEMPCYLTFDVDSIDPAYAPGTGTPVVDGLSPRDVIETIRGISDLNIVGMDIVEVSPRLIIPRSPLCWGRRSYLNISVRRRRGVALQLQASSITDPFCLDFGLGERV